MNVPEPKGELSTPTKSLKALPPKEDETKEEAEAAIQKSVATKAEAKKSLAQANNAPVEKVEIVPTKQEVVHEVFGHAHDARKQYVPKNATSKLPSDKEIGFVGQGTESGGPESLTQKANDLI